MEESHKREKSMEEDEYYEQMVARKKQKEAAKAQRGSWFGVNPVTRSTPNSHELKRRAEDKDAYLQMKNYKEDM